MRSNDVDWSFCSESKRTREPSHDSVCPVELQCFATYGKDKTWGCQSDQVKTRMKETAPLHDHQFQIIA